MPLIMLDGVDGAGKSTLAERLSARWSSSKRRWCRTIHRGQYDCDSYDEYENYLLSVYEPTDMNQLVILDRWHVSELIYGSVMRGKAKLSAYDVAHINRFLDSRGSLNILVHAPIRVIQERLQERGEDYLPADKVFTVAKMFNSVATDFKWHRLQNDMNFSDTGLDTVLNRAVEMSKQVALLSAPQSYVGPSAPGILVAVDRTTRQTPLPLQDEPHGVELKPYVGIVYAQDLSVGLLHRLGAPTVYGLDEAAVRVVADLGLGYVDVY